MADFRRQRVNDQQIVDLLVDSEFEDEAADINEIDDGLMAGISSVLSRDKDLSDSGSSSVKRSELESSDSDSQSERSDEDMTPAPSSQRKGRDRGMQQRGAMRRSRGITSRRVTNNRNVPASSSFDVRHCEWSMKNFNPQVISRIEPSYLPIDANSFTEKFDYFKLYIDDEIMKLIVLKTNQTFLSKYGKCLGLTTNELRVYIGITLAMSCIQYPQLRMYWQYQFRVALIADNMARNRFFLLRNCIKLVFDDDIPRHEKDKDRLWKVRPLISKIQNTCRALEKSTQIGIDEMIIPFSGNCGIKQYCPGKPNPTGLKAFVLANPDGTICDFCIYQGETTYPEYADTIHSLPEKAVLNLTKNLVPGHIVYFDRYFNGLRLAEKLLTKGIMCAGTLMKNRIPAPVRSLLQEDREMKRMGRGTTQVLVRDSGDVAITKWFDSKGIVFLSTVHANQTVDTCQRWSKKNRQYETINRPEVVKEYNTNMGGVDLADRLLSVCPFRYRTKKWTQRFTSHMIDIAVSNSWLMFKRQELNHKVPIKQIQQLRSYKLELAENMVKGNTEIDLVSDVESEGDVIEQEHLVKRKRGRKFVVPLPSNERRKKMHHIYLK